MSANLLGTEHHSPAHPRELDVGINGVRIRSLITFAYVTLEKGQFCPQAYIEYNALLDIVKNWHYQL
jgi:hypothetical protein